MLSRGTPSSKDDLDMEVEKLHWGKHAEEAYKACSAAKQRPYRP
jgi:hypothetical protein